MRHFTSAGTICQVFFARLRKIFCDATGLCWTPPHPGSIRAKAREVKDSLAVIVHKFLRPGTWRRRLYSSRTTMSSTFCTKGANFLNRKSSRAILPVVERRCQVQFRVIVHKFRYCSLCGVVVNLWQIFLEDSGKLNLTPQGSCPGPRNSLALALTKKLLDIRNGK